MRRSSATRRRRDALILTPPDHEKEQATGYESPVQLIETAEHERRDYRNQNSAQGAARGDGEVKRGEVFRCGLQAIKLAVAHHAAHEERGRVNGNLFIQREVGALKQCPADRARTGNQGQGKRKPGIPSRMVETDHEAEKIQGQWQHPQKWVNRHVLAEFVGDGEQ